MKRKFLIIMYFIFAFQIAKSQNIGINSTGLNPDGSAMLDISATNKGLLVPRVALTATNAAGPITSPLSSLFVYNTATAGTAPNNVIPGYYYWNGTAWVAFTTSTTPLTGWSLTGNSGTNIATNFLGTTDANDFLFKTNNTERMRMTSTGRVTVGLTYPLPGPSTLTTPFAVKDTIEIRRVGSVSQLLFTNTFGSGDMRISGDGGDLFLQGGGGRALQMGSYWTTVISGDRSLTTPPVFINGGSAPSVTNRSVLIASSRDISVPLSVQGNSISQSANLQEWLNSGGIAVSVIDNRGNMGIGTFGIPPTSTLQVKGSISLSVSLQSGNYTILSTDHIIINTGGSAASYTLPAANTAGYTGKIFRIINQGNNSITLNQGVYIDKFNPGASTIIPNTAGSNNYEIISDGTNWRKIN